jgi:hypothetical protein
LGGLTALQKLDLWACSQLHSLPESLGGLTALRKLGLRACSQLCSLLESLGGLAALQKLDLRSCNQLRSLPESLGGLTALLLLYVWGCSQLHSLPESLGGLTTLQKLDLRCCSQLHSLPESLGQLQMLEFLDLGGCSSLEANREQVELFMVLAVQLKSISIDGCSKLKLPAELRQHLERMPRPIYDELLTLTFGGPAAPLPVNTTKPTVQWGGTPDRPVVKDALGESDMHMISAHTQSTGICTSPRKLHQFLRESSYMF